MDVLSIAALFILLLIAGLVAAAIYGLGSWPGRVAKSRQHPYGTAILIGGWATLLAGGIFWPLMLTWAYATPEIPSQDSAEEETKS
jgi:prepilin signal peptidase PulO-like enzyme (type II secretory pathway)